MRLTFRYENPVVAFFVALLLSGLSQDSLLRTGAVPSKLWVVIVAVAVSASLTILILVLMAKISLHLNSLRQSITMAACGIVCGLGAAVLINSLWRALLFGAMTVVGTIAGVIIYLAALCLIQYMAHRRQFHPSVNL